MASTSASEIHATWEEGETCLAPSLRDGTLRDAKIQRLILNSVDNEAMALVVFTKNVVGGGVNDDNEEEEVKEAIPVSKLKRPGSDCFKQERPLFINSSFTIPGHNVPLVLSQPGSNGGEKVPYTINRYLRDYQREGIKFIYGNYSLRRGCILGDDMGLGKTVQVIGFLAAVLHKMGTWEDIENNRPEFLQTQMSSKQSRPNKVFLIVAPLSVLYNWKDELETWGHFQCVVVHGLRKEEELVRIRKGRVEIALTTYETLRLCLDSFNSIDWSAVIVDEAHKIKNPNSQITLAMKGLNCQVRVGLTGTILQNNIEELWCVMDWALPRCLGSIGHFKNNFSDLIERGQRHNATKRALATGRKTVRALARKISPWFLRRTKALIKEQLPKKDDRVVYCALTDFQQMVYQTVLDSEDVTLLLRSSEKCGCGSGRVRRSCCYQTNSEGVYMNVLYFSYLAILKKVANHVSLLQSTSGASEKQKKYATAICEKVFQKFPDFVQRCKHEAFEALSDPMYSGKMKVLQTLLKHYMQRRDKVLLFSISTKLLDVLESYCMAEGLDYSRLDGTTKSKDRVRIVKEFNSCPHTNLCLVSTMAGGLGLNIVGANVVVLFDPTWNPANDLQAIDRAYRIGQCRDVTVLRLIALGTVEEIIYLRQVYKQQLQCSVIGRESARRYFEAVQGDDDHKGELFGIKNLFRLQTHGTCLTSKILQREGRVEAGVMTTATHSSEQKQEDKEEKGRTCDSGDAPGHNLVLSDEAAQRPRGMSGVSRGILDFSSGSENEAEEEELGVRQRKKASDTNVADVAGSGRLSLLQQHDFSRLLQGAGAGSEVLDSGRSGGESGEESSLEEEINGSTGSSGKKEGTSSWVTKTPNTTENEADQQVRLQKTTKWHSSSGSDLDIEIITRDKVLSERRPELKNVIQKQKRAVGKGSDGYLRSNDSPYTSSTAVPRAHHFVNSSDESEERDLAVKTCPKIPHRRGVGKGKQRSGNSRKAAWDTSAMDQGKGSRHTEEEDIDTLTTSDEDHTPVKRGQPREHEAVEANHTEKKPRVSFTELRTSHSDPSPPAKTIGTIDKILGGLQGVEYTHSNQRVVGGSKAEARISRAAFRDVFERKMFSQLPANHLLGTQQSLSQSPPGSPHPCTSADRPDHLAATRRVDHPVTFTASTVHHTTVNTAIIGQTPQTIRRQHLEDMAAHFKCPSVGQFAEEVLRSSSGQRLSLLRQYYTSLNLPELADTVTSLFPKPEPAQTEEPAPEHRARTKRTSQKAVEENSSSDARPTKRSAPRREKKRRTQRNILEHPAGIPPAECERQKEDACDASRHSGTRGASVSIAGGGLGSDRTHSSGLGPREAAALLDHRDRASPSSVDHSHGPATAPGSMEQRLNNTTSEPPSFAPPPGSLLTDLIGDTSILDDLFRAKPGASPRRRAAPSRVLRMSSPQRTPASPVGAPPGVTVAANTDLAPGPKASRKDFWDILNEGNEESINRLTDPAEVQRVCVSTSHTARTREGRESGPLWKTNDKFLWRK